jgi:hypothetical protein
VKKGHKMSQEHKDAGSQGPVGDKLTQGGSEASCSNDADTRLQGNKRE